jgi:outer membrane receptor protein involved in Fe transport
MSCPHPVEPESKIRNDGSDDGRTRGRARGFALSLCLAGAVAAHDIGFTFMGSDPEVNTVSNPWTWGGADTSARARDSLKRVAGSSAAPGSTASVGLADSTTIGAIVPTVPVVQPPAPPDPVAVPDSLPPPPDTARVVQARKGADVVVVGIRPMTAFSRATFTDRDLSLRVKGGDPAEVVQVAPGLFTGQHSGGGKANQYFIRGFDCDHGTDLAIRFDGVPVNEPSHAHGQGYADLHFVIPELVDRVQVDKGPYDIRFGDFATAASIDMGTRASLDRNEAYVYGGAFGTFRAVSLLSVPDGVAAAEFYHSDGPFLDPEDHQRFNVFYKDALVSTPDSRLVLSLLGHSASWNASGQIPLRAVDSGWIPLYGSLDPSEGGSTQRFGATLDWSRRPDPRSTWRTTAYAVDSRFSLFSDFTFFQLDTANGDEIDQREDRVTTGFRSEYRLERSIAGVPASTTAGVEARFDRVETALDHARRRAILGQVVDARVDESSLSEYAMESIQPFRWLYVEAGVRGDRMGFEVADRLHPAGDSSLAGSRDAHLWSPKANVVFTPVARTDVFLNYGEGFHSNDARGTTRAVDPATPMAKARGYEVGIRTRPWKRLDLAASLWRLDLSEETVWSGDEGGTESAGATRRQGVDASARLRILDWLWSDLDLTRNSSVYRSDAGNGNAVALAPRFTASGGLSVRHPSGLFGSLRFQHLDDRPADAADSLRAKGFTVVDLSAGLRRGDWEFSLDLGNLTDTRWYTAQFETTSRIRDPRGELGPSVTDMDVVPGPPINLKAGLKRYF